MDTLSSESRPLKTYVIESHVTGSNRPFYSPSQGVVAGPDIHPERCPTLPENPFLFRKKHGSSGNACYGCYDGVVVDVAVVVDCYCCYCCNYHGDYSEVGSAYLGVVVDAAVGIY